MQKINVTTVVKNHLRTFKDEKGSWSKADILTFFVVPLAFGVVVVWSQWQVPEKALELSISVFSIFAALLLSVQVALYSVSLR